MRGLRLKSSFLVLPENRVIGFVLLPIRPAELGKTTNTTFTTSNNLRAVARIALLPYVCMGLEEAIVPAKLFHFMALFLAMA